MADNLCERLSSAICIGDIEAVKSLLDLYGLSHPELCSQSDYFLYESVLRGQINIVKLLLERGAEVNEKNHRKNSFFTPLHCAVQSGFDELVSMLLEKGALVDAKDCSNETPLHIAVAEENLEIIELLLNNMADIEAKTEDGSTPLHLAVGLLGRVRTWAEDFKRIYDSLCKLGIRNREDTMDMTDTTKAYKHGEEIVKLLVDRGADVDAQNNNGRTVLEVALLQCKFQIIESVLFARPAVKGKVNEHCLRVAVESSGVEYSGIAELLVGYDFTLKHRDVKHHGLLHIAVRNGFTNIIEDLLKLGADVEVKHKIANGFTLLHSAAASRRIRIAELLIEHGSDVNARDELDKTPILYAIENMDSNMTKLFLTNGANDEGKPSLIHTAATKGHFHIMEMILDKIPSIDVNAVNSVASTSLRFTEINKKSCFWRRIYEDSIEADSVTSGDKYELTALHIAAAGGFARVVELLLKHNANVGSVAETFGTPLHCSVLQRDEAIVEMLLLKGAEVDAKREDGTTSLQLAVEEGNVKAFKVLIKHGADVHERNNKGLNLVHMAAKWRHLNVFEEDLLDVIKAGHPQDNHGFTALHYAVRKGSLADVEILLRHGADASVKDIFGNTPLHDVAGSGGKASVVEALLEALLDNIDSFYNIDATNDEGYTALRCAVGTQHVGAVCVLLYHGCDVNIKDELGQTPLEVISYAATHLRNCYMESSFTGSSDNALDRSLRKIAERNMRHAVMIGDEIVKMMVLDLSVNDDNLYVNDDNLYVNDDNQYFIDMTTFNDGIYNRCKEEIEIMKGTKIGESVVSFYQFLTAGRRQLALYSRNQIIAEVLEKGDHKYTFKLYCDLIDWRFRKTKIVNDLIDSSARSLRALSGYSLTDYDYLEIFGYLRRRDLENVIKAGVSVDKSNKI